MKPNYDPSDPPRQSLSLAAGVAAFSCEGAGPEIVAIHGLPGSGRDFRWLAPKLTPFARMVRVDLPGFGETPVAAGPDPSPLGRARFVLELVEALGLSRPVLLGHSMGGVVACAAADLAPDRFAALALLASPGPRRHPMLRWVPFRLLVKVLTLPVLGSMLRPVNRRLFALGGFKGYPDSALLRTLHCVAATSIPEHAANLRRLDLPTLVAWCEDDDVIPAKYSVELAAVCPEGPRLCFPKGGHNLQKTHAEEIAQAIAPWLESTTYKAPRGEAR